MKKPFLVLFLITLLIHSDLIGQKKYSDEVDSLDLMIGQMILTGLGDFNELDPNESVFQSIRDGEVGGLILFSKNLSNTETEDRLKTIIDHAQSQTDIPLFISIDGEGGRVNRLKPKYGFQKSVSAQYLGELDNPDSTEHYGEQTAAMLYRLGINMNFAPVLDVNLNLDNPVIGKVERSFSPNPEKVAEHAGIVIDAHDLFGITAVVKHFPGHGSSKTDSHLGLTDVSSTWRFEELKPYKMLLDSGKVKAVMSAHIVNEVLDDRKLPATLSDKVIKNVLRDFLHYDGVVISDDMQMRAISAEYGLKEAIKMAILADVDILLFANNVPDYELVTAHQIHQIISEFVKSGAIPVERIQQSYKRIIELKKEMGLL